MADVCKHVPIAVIDLDDRPYLNSAQIRMLEECLCYFKREVPYDRFALYSQHRPRPWRIRRNELLPLLEKVKGIPLGITDDKFSRLKALRVDMPDEQDIDLFWSGQLSNTIRIGLLNVLEDFARENAWNIVIAKEPLPFSEYCSLVARSKLTLSAAGGGWDCFRHYEAIALGSLPLINRPIVDAVWWQNMPEEISFDNNLSNVLPRIEQLLTRPELHQSCFAEVEEMVHKHMVWSKIVEYIVNESMKHIKT
jgi:hypothetical protein